MFLVKEMVFFMFFPPFSAFFLIFIHGPGVQPDMFLDQRFEIPGKVRKGKAFFVCLLVAGLMIA